MVKIGIIGTGFGSTQAKVFAQLPDTRVVALCGYDKEKTERIAHELHIPDTYTDYTQLLADPDLDLIVIASPNRLHHEMFSAAKKSGKHILLEKPAAVSSGELEKMLQESQGYPKHIMVDHEMRFNPITQKILELVPTLGKISALQIAQYTDKGSDLNSRYSWMQNKEAGGGQILLMGTHLLDLALFLLGFPEIQRGSLLPQIVTPLRKDAYGNTQQVTAEDQFSASFKTASGVALSFFNTIYSFGYKDFQIKIWGTDGILQYSDQRGLFLSTENQELLPIIIPDSLPEIQAGNSFVSKSFKYFAQEIIAYLEGKQRSPSYCTLGQELNILKILEQADRL